MEKLPIFDENDALTPLEKSQFFDFFNFLWKEEEQFCENSLGNVSWSENSK